MDDRGGVDNDMWLASGDRTANVNESLFVEPRTWKDIVKGFSALVYSLDCESMSDPGEKKNKLKHHQYHLCMNCIAEYP